MRSLHSDGNADYPNSMFWELWSPHVYMWTKVQITSACLKISLCNELLSSILPCKQLTSLNFDFCLSNLLRLLGFICYYLPGDVIPNPTGNKVGQICLCVPSYWDQSHALFMTLCQEKSVSFSGFPVAYFRFPPVNPSSGELSVRLVRQFTCSM